MRDYSIYKFTFIERIKYMLIAVSGIAVISYIFYRSMVLFIMLLPLSLFYPGFIKNKLIRKRKQKLESEFKEALLVVSALLSAGYSLENAVKESIAELKLLYDKPTFIIPEFEYINHLIYMNIPAEKAFEDFGERSGADDIRNFAKVLKIGKRSGGELVSVINHTASVISDKIRIKEEIITMTSAKRYEQRIMNLFPVFIVLYIDSSSPGFFNLMYSSIFGKAVMTACLAVYLFAYCLSDRLLNIEV